VQLLNGKTLAEELNRRLAERVRSDAATHGRPPGLATVLVGEDPASKLYVGMKIKACTACGIKNEAVRLPATATLDEVLGEVARLNAAEDIDGILVQVPLPGDLRQHEKRVMEAIDPRKDVDGFSAASIGLNTLGDETYAPCTPKGMVRLLEENQIPIQGQEVVIINRTPVIGKPLAMMFTNRSATVTVCHTKTRDLAFHTKRADILATGVGRPGFITAEMVKPGVVILDAGICHDEQGRLCGDVAFDEVSPLCRAITPVPGGVGPMTIAMLMENTHLAYLARVTNRNR
jgi:methylenetetrahydrofolate dehydrogenase (NADP+)/methenyltetrahydrofolate cyclohydrolase